MYSSYPLPNLPIHSTVTPTCSPLLAWPSWRSLPGVDFSNESSAKRTLLVSAVRRFLTLRAEVGGWAAFASQGSGWRCIA